MNLLKLIIVFSVHLFAHSTKDHVKHEYCIIGAGPAGLQLGYFLSKVNRDYIIFEKNNNSGSFFDHYPRHRKLISLNKRNTGEVNTDFNLRHDWNSLLTNEQNHDDSLKFTTYSNSNFPDAGLLVKYLDDYKAKFNLNVQYNTIISNVSCKHRNSNNKNKRGCLFEMNDQFMTKYSCNILIIATGLHTPNIPENLKEDTDGYEDFLTDPNQYEGKSVLILGRGNAAFETAQSIYGVTNLIHMVARSRIRNAYSTHYVGDLRAVNNELLDTYQLKSLDGFMDLDLENVEFIKIDDKLYLTERYSSINDTNMKINSRVGYDKVIRCLGFKFDYSLFENPNDFARLNGRIKKYPKIDGNYESAEYENLFFAGTIAHSLDFRKSSGGFIHGFRYNVRALHRIIESHYQKVNWPSKVLGYENILSYTIKRVNEASGTYQMFGQLVDIISLNEKNHSFEYFTEFPIVLLDKLEILTRKKIEKLILVNYQYNSDYSGPGKDVFRSDRVVSDPELAHESNFLHPVFYYYKALPNVIPSVPGEILKKADRTHHMLEDFLTFWTDVKLHQIYLQRFFESILNVDLKKYSRNECLNFRLAFGTYPISCKRIFFSK